MTDLSSRQYRPRPQRNARNSEPRAGYALARAGDAGERQAEAVEAAVRFHRPTSGSGVGGVNLADHHKPVIQPKASDAGLQGSSTVLSWVASGIDQTIGHGKPLDSAAQHSMEGHLQTDLSNVRIHDDEKSHKLTTQLKAKAFTVGQDVWFNRDRYNPHTSEGRGLLAHELTHTVQQQKSNLSVIQRAPDPKAETESVTTPSPRFDTAGTVRASPGGGVAIRGGTLTWRLEVVDTATRRNPTEEVRETEDGAMILTRGKDVDMVAEFTPSGGGSCQTYTFLQIVNPQVNGVPNAGHPHILNTRDDATGYSVDALTTDTDPYYGAEPFAGRGGMTAETGASLAGSAAGRSTSSTFHDTPTVAISGIHLREMANTQFEVAVICVETGETFGSLRYGVQKDFAGRIRLTGATVSDVRTSTASADLERVRQLWYDRYFQHSMHSFARGSATLSSTHRATLDSIALIRDIHEIILAGSSDNSGGPESDPDLSMERAIAARDYLIGQGVDPSVIKTQGHGVNARIPNPAGSSVAENRRVDVRVVRGRTFERSPESGSPLEEWQLKKLPTEDVQRSYVQAIDVISAPRYQPTDRECRQFKSLRFEYEMRRRADADVPDVDALYGPLVEEALRKCSVPMERVQFDLGPINQIEAPDSFLDRTRLP